MKKAFKYFIIIIIVFGGIAGGIYAYQDTTEKCDEVYEYKFPTDKAREADKDGMMRISENYEMKYSHANGLEGYLQGKLTKGKVIVELASVDDAGKVKSTKSITYAAPVNIDTELDLDDASGRATIKILYSEDAEGSFTIQWTEHVRNFWKLLSFLN